MPAPILELDLRPIPAEETHPLRHRVLRPHQPPEALHYPGDLQPGSLHLGAFTPQGTLIGIASLSVEPMPGEGSEGTASSRAFRLRGMAVEPAFQGRGVGARLIDACLVQAAREGLSGIWCNARLTAEPFYLRRGFRRVGEVFELEGIGPHVVMHRELT